MRTWKITGTDKDGEPAEMLSTGPERTKEAVIRDVNGSHPEFTVTDAVELPLDEDDTTPRVEARINRTKKVANPSKAADETAK
jgi:hypothetical protein